MELRLSVTRRDGPVRPALEYQEHHLVVGQAYEIEGIVLHPVAPRSALRRLGTTASRRRTMVPVHTMCQKRA